MNEAGLISAAVGAAPEVEATVQPSRLPGEVAPALARPSRSAGLRQVAQAAVAVLAAAAAFASSLLTLAAGFPAHPVLGAISVVPLISLGLAVIIAIRPASPERDIHDRYLDYILGLALLGTAAAAILFLSRSLSIFFWSWRLDMLAMPLFLAGAVTLLGGSRLVWRFRLPIAFLFMAWPLPYAAAGFTSRPGARTAVVVLAAAVLAGLVAVGVGRRTPRWASPPVPTSGRRPGGGLLAAGLVLVAASLTAIADRQLDSALLLLRADGRPKLSAVAPLATTVAGLPRTGAADPPNLPTWATPGSEQTYRYDPGITVEILTPSDGRALSLPPAAIVEAQGYRRQSAVDEDLGGALVGHLERYAAAPGTSLLIVWWDWPAASPAGAVRQRVIVERLNAPTTAGADQLVRIARDLVASLAASAHATSP